MHTMESFIWINSTKKFLNNIIGLLFILILQTSYAQIAFQGFESTTADNWNYTATPTFYVINNAPNSNDYWHITTATDNIPADDGNFVGGEDLRNANNATGATQLTFDPIAISGSVAVSFRMYYLDYDFSDDIYFEVAYDNGTDWSSPDYRIQLVDHSVTNATSGGWINVSHTVPAGNTHVRMRIDITQNGSDEIGLDAFKVINVVPVCSAPTAQATNATFATTTSSSLTLSGFTAPVGDADGYVVYINSSNSFTAPSDGDEPTADTSWNDAGQQPIYFGTSIPSNLEVTGLDSGTTYYYQIYSYNDCNGTETYETTGLNVSNTTATIPTITFADINKTYGDDDFTLGAMSNSGGTISYSIVAGGTGSATLSGTNNETVTLGNAGTVTIRVTQAADGIYSAETKDITLTINQKVITVTADDILKKEGEIDPELTYQINETLIKSDAFTGSLEREIGETIGDYQILQGTLSSGSNYNITYISGKFTITEVLNLENKSISKQIELHPVPTSKIVNLKIDTSVKVEHIYIYNALGKLVKELSSNQKIDISNFSNGMYFIRIKTDKGIGVKRIIKQ